MASRCETCGFCNYAQGRPDTVIGRLWRWHTTWCPCWKAYQEELSAKASVKKDPL